MNLLLQVEALKKYFPVRTGFLSTLFRRDSKYVHAVDGVSFEVLEGETLSIVGESGCGKTTLGRLCLGLLEPTEGTVRYKGKSIFGLNFEETRRIRREVQIVFQDPLASLNPRKTVRQILSRPLKIHNVVPEDQITERCHRLLEMVGITPPEYYIDRYPHEFSGGQRQRIGVARAIALEPKLIVADEPVSSLDVSVRAQVLKMLRELQKRLGLTFLFITHDLAVVRTISNRVAVMYLGEFVEFAFAEDLYKESLHPYTQALLAATPIPNPRRARSRQILTLTGELPSSTDPPSGCRFRTRCPHVFDKCSLESPELKEVKPNHFVSCHLYK